MQLERQPLTLRHDAPVPQGVDWSTVSEVHAYGPLGSEHLALTQEALRHHRSIIMMDAGAKDKLDPCDE